MTEGSQILDLPTNKTEVRVEIKAMASAMLKINTFEQKGPIKIQIQFQTRGEGDQTCLIHRERDISDENFIYEFKNKTRMCIYPKKAWTSKLTHPKDKSASSPATIWQPECLFVQISSNSGCSFTITAVFVLAEEAELKRANAKFGNNEKALSNFIRDDIKR